MDATEARNMADAIHERLASDIGDVTGATKVPRHNLERVANKLYELCDALEDKDCPEEDYPEAEDTQPMTHNISWSVTPQGCDAYQQGVTDERVGILQMLRRSIESDYWREEEQVRPVEVLADVVLCVIGRFEDKHETQPTPESEPSERTEP